MFKNTLRVSSHRDFVDLGNFKISVCTLILLANVYVKFDDELFKKLP